MVATPSSPLPTPDDAPSGPQVNLKRFLLQSERTATDVTSPIRPIQAGPTTETEHTTS